MMLTASFKNWIVQFADSCLDRCHRKINFHASAIIQCARINRSKEEKETLTKCHRMLEFITQTHNKFYWGL